MRTRASGRTTSADERHDRERRADVGHVVGRQEEHGLERREPQHRAEVAARTPRRNRARASPAPARSDRSTPPRRNDHTSTYSTRMRPRRRVGIEGRQQRDGAATHANSAGADNTRRTPSLQRPRHAPHPISLDLLRSHTWQHGRVPIRVLHYGLGPIGAAVVRQVAARRGFKIVGAVDIDPAKAGRDLGEVAGVGRALRVKVSSDARKTIKATKPDVVVLCTLSSLKKVTAADGGDPEAQGPDRLDDRGAGVSDRREHEYARAHSRDGEEGEGRRARHRRQPRLHDGRAADHADRRLRARRQHPRRSHPGRARPPAAVPAEDRRRPHARAVPEEGGRRQRAPRRARRIGVDDCRRDGLEAGQDHRRDPAEDRRRRPWRASSSRSIPATSAASSRTASATATASRSSRCTWKRTSARRSRSTRWTIAGSPTITSKIAGGVHGDVATASITVNSIPKILEVAPGLHTMRDMPIPSYYGG